MEENTVESVTSKSVHSWVPCRVIECRYYKLGFCKKAERCAFYHGLHDQRCPPDLSKTQLCPEMKDNSTCPNKEKCMYAHSTEELRKPPKKSVLCKAWLNDGICPYLDCHYAHSFDEITTVLLHPELGGIPVPPSDAPKFSSKNASYIPPPPPPLPSVFFSEKEKKNLKSHKKCSNKTSYLPPPPLSTSHLLPNTKTYSKQSIDDEINKKVNNKNTVSSRSISIFSSYSTDSDLANLSTGSFSMSLDVSASFSPVIDPHVSYVSTTICSTCENHYSPLSSKTHNSLLSSLSPSSNATDEKLLKNITNNEELKTFCLSPRSKEEKEDYQNKSSKNNTEEDDTEEVLSSFSSLCEKGEKNENKNIKNVDVSPKINPDICHTQIHEINRDKNEVSYDLENCNNNYYKNYLAYMNTLYPYNSISPYYFHNISDTWAYKSVSNIDNESIFSSIYPLNFYGYNNVHLSYNNGAYLSHDNGAFLFHNNLSKIDLIKLFWLTWGKDLTHHILERASIPIHMYTD